MIQGLFSEKEKYIEESKLEDQLLDFCRAHSSLYLYGAGAYGNALCEYLELNGILISGFLLSEPDEIEHNHYPVYRFEDHILKLNECDGVILSLKEDYQSEIIEKYDPVLKAHRIDAFLFPGALFRMMRMMKGKKLYDLIKKVREWETTYPASGRDHIEDCDRIAVIQLEDAIGDTIWGSAFLRELRRNHPHTWITYVANEAMKGLLQECPYVDRIVYYPYVCEPFSTYDALEKRVKQFYDESIHESFDVVFLLKALPIHTLDQIENVLLALYSGASVRFAHAFYVFEGEKYYYQLWSKLFPVTAINDRAEHDVLKDLSLISLSGGDIADTKMELWLSEQDIKEAKAHLENLRKGETKLVALGLAGREPRRNWPGGNYLEFADALFERYGERITFVLFGASNAREAADIVLRTKATVIDLVGKTSLEVSAAAIGFCDLYVGADTSLLHMASANNIPIVELTANLKDGRDIDQGSVVRTGPWHVSNRVIYPKWALDGCTHRCIKEFTHCITQIRTDEVVEAAVNLLERE